MPDDRYTHVPAVPFHDLGSIAAGFDIGIAPLADIPCNRCRSNVKLKEYSIGGTPWLASPIGAYAELGEREGGRLVAPERWVAELTRPIRNARKRRKLGRRAERWGKLQLMHQNMADRAGSSQTPCG